MTDPRTSCHLMPPCGEHTVTSFAVIHRDMIGVTTLQRDELLNVDTLLCESPHSARRIGPLVAVRWPADDEQGQEQERIALDGIDLYPDEALALGQLLIAAAGRLLGVQR